ncbi:MAG TPA: hypothetical protein VHQ47_12145 [Phycisphaerae bacterium]|nr:hypothetical protein [Phycisphaerae bacterium]
MSNPLKGVRSVEKGDMMARKHKRPDFPKMTTWKELREGAEAEAAANLRELFSKFDPAIEVVAYYGYARLAYASLVDMIHVGHEPERAMEAEEYFHFFLLCESYLNEMWSACDGTGLLIQRLLQDARIRTSVLAYYDGPLLCLVEQLTTQLFRAIEKNVTARLAPRDAERSIVVNPASDEVVACMEESSTLPLPENAYQPKDEMWFKFFHNRPTILTSLFRESEAVAKAFHSNGYAKRRELINICTMLKYIQKHPGHRQQHVAGSGPKRQLLARLRKNGWVTKEKGSWLTPSGERWLQACSEYLTLSDGNARPRIRPRPRR